MRNDNWIMLSSFGLLFLLLFLIQEAVIVSQRRQLEEARERIQRITSLVHDANEDARKFQQMYSASEKAAEQCEQLSGLNPNQ
jgi:predicted translin family RNA/ssDNA-binding protein